MTNEAVVTGITERGRDMVRKLRAMREAGVPQDEIDAWWGRQMKAAREAKQ